MSLWTQDNAKMVLAKEIKVLEILKRAKGFQSGEGISFLESEANVREEALRRSAKAGYCTRNGESRDATKIMAKPANEQYRKNYKRIFGHD